MNIEQEGRALDFKVLVVNWEFRTCDNCVHG